MRYGRHSDSKRSYIFSGESETTSRYICAVILIFLWNLLRKFGTILRIGMGFGVISHGNSLCSTL